MTFGEGGFQIDLTQLLTPQVITAVAVVAGILMLLLAVGALLLVRAARRRRWISPGAVKKGMLAVKAQALPPGPAREVALLRLRLRDALDRTRRILEVARGGDRSVGELPGILARTERLAESLDQELALVEMQSGGGTARASLNRARGRVDELLQVLEKIRQAATGASDGASKGELIALQADLDLELGALREGVEALRRLGPAQGSVAPARPRLRAERDRRRR